MGRQELVSVMTPYLMFYVINADVTKLPSFRTLSSEEDNYSKDGGREFLTKMHCALITNNDPIEMRLQNVMHLGKIIASCHHL